MSHDVKIYLERYKYNFNLNYPIINKKQEKNMRYME